MSIAATFEAPNRSAAPSAAGVRSGWPAATSSAKNHSACHRNAEHGEHAEVQDGVSRDEPERRGTDLLTGERAREGGRCVKRPARKGVDREEPERYHQPGEDTADDAVRDQTVQ